MPKVRQLRPLTRDGLSEEVRLFRLSVDNESDRGCALMVGAFLDAELERLLRAHLIDDPKTTKTLFEWTGPLATFSARIGMAYGMGLISPRTMADLTQIRQIRNEFSHVSDLISFATDRIKQRCAALTCHNRDRSSPSRTIFNSTAIYILALIHGAYIKAQRPEIKKELLTDAMKAKLTAAQTEDLEAIKRLPAEVSGPILSGLVPYKTARKIIKAGGRSSKVSRTPPESGRPSKTPKRTRSK